MARTWRSLTMVVVAWATLVLPGGAQAATIVARSVPYMTQHADAVVHGRVVAQAVEIGPDGDPYTRSTLSLHHVWKGELGATVDVWQKGGALPDGSILTIPGDVTLAQGDDVVLFLHHDGTRHWSFLLGWSAFDVLGFGPEAPIARDATQVHALGLDPDGVLRPATKDDLAAPPTLGDLEALVTSALAKEVE